jgi:hypothetical protein
MNTGAESVRNTRRLRLGAVIAVAVALGFVVWLIAKDDDDGGSNGGRGTPTAASVDDLRALSRSVGHPIYWAGPRRGYTYELTHTKRGNIYVRYLPEDVKVGDARPLFTTVGTYPLARAYDGVRREARRKGAISKRLGGGGLAAANPERRSSVYFAYPRSGFQIEVYDPSPKRARDLVFSGLVRPVR